MYVSEGTAINKTSTSKDFDVCDYWCFLNFSFKFQSNVWNRCHGLIMMSVNLSDIAILNIKGSHFCCIISLISKNEATSLMQNADLTEKNQNIIKHKNLLSRIKMGKGTFGDIEFEKNKFYRYRSLLFWRI